MSYGVRLRDTRQNHDLKMQLETLRSLERIVYFFDCQKNVLGKVYAISGFSNINNNNNAKIDGNRRLDWALIKVNKSRIGTNKLPDEEAWLRKAGLENPFTYGAQHQSQAKIPEAYSRDVVETLSGFRRIQA